jgi:chromosome segregation ATPase
VQEELSRTQDLLTSRQTACSALEQEISRLKALEAKHQAEKVSVEALKDEVVGLRSAQALWLIEKSSLEARLQQDSEALSMRADEQLAAAQAEKQSMRALAQERAALESQIRHIHAELDAGKDAIARNKSQIEKLRGELQRLDSDVLDKTSLREKLSEDVASARKQLHKCNESIREQSARHESVVREVESAQKQLRRCNEEIKEQTDVRDSVTKDVEDARKELDQLRTDKQVISLRLMFVALNAVIRRIVSVKSSRTS